ncbi:hypothetical protein LCGC14_3136180, partial [marine sediment metagenome]
NKTLGRRLIFAESSEGKPTLLPASEVPLGERGKTYFEFGEDAKLRSWMRIGRKTKENALIKKDTPKRIKKLFNEKIYIHRDAFHTIENIMSARSSEAYTKYAQIRMGVKRGVMYNPLIHGFNFESNVISMLGRDYLKTRYFHGLDEVGMQNLAKDFVLNGGELMGLYNISKRLGADIYEMRPLERIKLKDVIEDPTKALRHPIKAFVDLNDQILWDKWIKTGQLLIYKVAKERMVERHGLSVKEAGDAAAMIANDLSGSPPRTWFTKRQRFLLTNLLFARSWNTGLMRTLTGALPKRIATSSKIPKFLRFEGLSDNQLRGLSKEYRKVIIKTIVGFYAT